MSESEKKTVHEDKIRIANEVVATIAGIAASEVENVTSMSGGLADGIANILGRKNLSKGVKVEVTGKEAVIDINIIVEYGCRIHEVAKEIQSKVRQAVEGMTGLNVVEVNVNVLGVNTETTAKKQAESEELTSLK
ncbi:MAG: Asp23/Gls24 family envelope stress response protein [Clostridia bacterium]|nr:Asp23/Gls24 family envelope stress response protein [Clostridia bacterium]